MADKFYNVLFLCTGNSARSILAESIINKLGKGKFHGFSAGSYPKGQVHPIALALLRQLDFPTDGLRSKSWDEFATPDSVHLDFVFTVCDNAAGEVCPAWPGQPMTAHWGIPDPAAAQGTDVEKGFAFREAFRSDGNADQIVLESTARFDRSDAAQGAFGRDWSHTQSQYRRCTLNHYPGDCSPRVSDRGCWQRPWWALGSWRNASAVVTSRLRSWPTRALRSQYSQR